MREGWAKWGPRADWQLAIGHWLMAIGILPIRLRIKLGGLELRRREAKKGWKLAQRKRKNPATMEACGIWDGT